MRFALALATLAVAALPGSALGDNPTLTGVVGVNDGFNITLNDASGKKVSRILPGTYTIVVEDHSAIHNFHLASNGDPTVDFKTGLEFIGTQSFTVTFQNNTTYAYACEPHWQTMNGSFLVTDAPPAPASAAASSRAAGREAGRIGLCGRKRSSEPVVGACRPCAPDGQRSLEEGQLPPDREGREQAHRHDVPRVGQVEPASGKGDVPLRQRRPPADGKAAREVRLRA